MSVTAAPQATPSLGSPRTSPPDRWTTPLRVIDVLTLPAMILALYMAMIKAPDEQVMHSVYRLFYFHVPAAVASFGGFTIVFVCSIAYLRTRRMIFDRVAVAAAEVGVVFCSLGIVLGMIWAKPVWNTFWIPGDVHLMTTAILWLAYVSYLMLRGAIDDGERRARLSSVLGIILIVLVPIVFFSIRVIQQGSHPVLTSGLPTSMAIPFMVNMALMQLFFVFFFLRRVRLENQRAALADLRDQFIALTTHVDQPTQLAAPDMFLPRRPELSHSAKP